MLEHGKLDPVAYSIQDGILYQCVLEGGQSFHAIYVPKTPAGLIQSILKAAHDELIDPCPNHIVGCGLNYGDCTCTLSEPSAWFYL